MTTVTHTPAVHYGFGYVGDVDDKRGADTKSKLIAATSDLLAACVASEREYDEESTPGDANCPDCTLDCIPILKPVRCAHHLRVAAIAKAHVRT